MRKPVFQIKTCACGCGDDFKSNRTYYKRGPDGGPTFPDFKPGHDPNSKKNTFGNIPAWNAGRKKGDHPSMDRMGFQKGHAAFCDWSHLHERQRNDPDYRKRWIKSKMGQVAWNRGLRKDQYPNGIASGPNHGNWMGGQRGLRDTAEYQEFRRQILRRDNYTCQLCGDRNYKGRGSRARLEVDHIEPVCVAPHRTLDPENARTLCVKCHIGTETYGPKVRHYIRKRRDLG